MKIKTHKQLYILLSILAFLIAGTIGYILKSDNLPYTFVLDKKTLRTKSNAAFIYIDFDNDGISEKIQLASAFQGSGDKKTTNDNIIIYNDNNVEVDQFNLFSYSSPDWLHFEDYNNDGYKEIFAFSSERDSLFLSIINIKAKRYILQRQFILSKPDSAKKNFWDIWVQAQGLLKVDNSNSKDLIFQVIGAYSIYPRSVYSYNIKERRIRNKFETGSLLHIVEFGDLNNDGNKDMIIYTDAPANMTEKVGYHDYNNWLFVLNKNLKPLFTPRKIGSYPGSISVHMITSKNERKLFVVSYELKNSKKVSVGLLYNSKGELLDTLNYLPQNLNRPFKATQNRKDFIYVSTKDGNLLKLNNQLQIVNKRSSVKKTLSIISEINFDNTQSKALFCNCNGNNIYIIDKDLNTLAKYKLGEQFYSFKGHYSIKYNGKNKPLQLAIVGSNNNFLFTIKENKIYTYLPLIILGISFLSFILVGSLHILYSFISTYIQYFRYSLQRASRGIAILNSHGRISYNNSNLIKFLNIKTSVKKESYQNLFKDYKDILSTISYCFNTKKQIRNDIRISTPDYHFEGDVTITPFSSFIGFTHSYLLEISDFTEPLLTDRGKVWGATLQRIAHEIKTPLSTLILSLENIKSRLVEKDYKVNDELNMMQEELERIKLLTKNFMMFTNLEETEPAIVSITKILKESINNFRSYFEKEMILNFKENEFFVFADERQLVQLFSLVIENAIDACEGKGIISIATETSNNNSNHCIKIIIKDNGKGMDSDILQKIFEPYFTTKKDGTGLGLSLVKKIVEDNRGKLEIDSQVGEGTVVIVYLKAAKL